MIFANKPSLLIYLLIKIVVTAQRTSYNLFIQPGADIPITRVSP